MIKRPISNAGNTIWNRDAFQVGVRKRIISNAGNTIWNRNAFQDGVRKRIISNAGDTIFNHYFFNIRVVEYRALIAIFVIFHRSRTADGQRAVGGEFPGQVVFVPVGYDFAFVYAEVITFSVEPLSRYTVKL